jgi:hypothetical protein
MYGQNNNRILIKIPEVQKQENSIDCGLHPIISSIVSGLPQLQFIGISRELYNSLV